MRERAGGSSASVCLAWYHHPTTRRGEEGGVALASPSQVWKKQAPPSPGKASAASSTALPSGGPGPEGSQAVWDYLGLSWLHPGQSSYRTRGWDGRPDPDLWAAGID